MRRLDGGAGRRRDRRTGPQLRQPRPAIPGLVLVRRPRCPARNRYPGGVGSPPGDTTVPAREPADLGPQNAPESAARRRKETAAAGRRKARRPTSLAGDLRRSADRSARETDHRVRRSAPAPSGSAPLISLGERKRTKGTRPSSTGGGALADGKEDDARDARAANSVRSPIPCGEGLGVGVLPCVAVVQQTRPPSPTLPLKGEGAHRVRGYASASPPRHDNPTLPVLHSLQHIR